MALNLILSFFCLQHALLWPSRVVCRSLSGIWISFTNWGKKQYPLPLYFAFNNISLQLSLTSVIDVLEVNKTYFKLIISNLWFSIPSVNEHSKARGLYTFSIWASASQRERAEKCFVAILEHAKKYILLRNYLTVLLPNLLVQNKTNWLEQVEKYDSWYVSEDTFSVLADTLVECGSLLCKNICWMRYLS